MEKYEEMETFELKNEVLVKEAEKDLYQAIIINRQEEIRLVEDLIRAVGLTGDFDSIYDLATIGKRKQAEIKSYEKDVEYAKSAWIDAVKELESRGERV